MNRAIIALVAALALLAGCNNVEKGQAWEYVEVDGMDCIHYQSGYQGSLDCDWSMKGQR